MNSDLVLQLAGIANGGATIMALVLGHLANKKAKQTRRDAQEARESDPVTLTGAIRVLRYLETLAERKGKHERPTDSH